MRPTLFLISILSILPARAESPIDDLVAHLQESRHATYFPAAENYFTLEDTCSDGTRLTILVLDTVTDSMKGMRKVAVFSDSDGYLGFYAGFNDLSVSMIGCDLAFEENANRDKISFVDGVPPARAWIDGEVFDFIAADSPVPNEPNTE